MPNSLQEKTPPTGWLRSQSEPPLLDVFRSVPVAVNATPWRKFLAFLGPGYLVAVGYMDPGNWATSLAGGSKFGYALLFVALVSNIMAIILQSLCARLAIATGRDLAQACRDAFPRWAAWPLWLMAEIAVCATDLAEIIGTAIGLTLLFGIPLEIGKGRVVREGKTVAILSLGTRLAEAMKAADTLDAKGLSTTVADLRFAKPLDEELIRKLMTTHEVIITIEEAAIGGLGAHVLTLASDHGLLDAGLKIRTLRLPDTFQDHNAPDKQYDEAGLNAPHIVEAVLKALRWNETGVVAEVRA